MVMASSNRAVQGVGMGMASSNRAVHGMGMVKKNCQKASVLF